MLGHFKAHVLFPFAEKALQRDIRSKLSVLRDTQKKSPDERRALQQSQLFEIVSRAQAHVPYYRDLFKKINFNSELLSKDLKYFDEIPPLTKEDLREHGAQLIHEKYKDHMLHIRKTNGSTGLVTNIWYDQDSLDWTAAANQLSVEMSGRSLSEVEVTISSEFDDETIKQKFVNTFKRWSLNRINLYTKSFRSQDLLILLSKLQKIKPTIVFAHPSTLYFAAIEGEKLNKSFRNIFKYFEPTGESLESHKVEKIKEVFGCKVFNRYGNAEFGVLAHSREDYRNLEVFDSIVYAESHSLGNGMDELIFTGLKNPAMPLIRYRTGDVGEVYSENGVSFIRNLFGRVHDVFEIHENTYPTHFLQDILDRTGGIDEWQILIPKNSSQLKLQIVPNKNFSDQKLISTLAQHFGPNAFCVNQVGLDGLRLSGWRDKFRYVVKE